MYLDLNEEEIKRYIDGGYVVEEVDQMDLGGTPHNHPHEGNLLVNPWARKPMANSNYNLRTQDMMNDYRQKTGAIVRDMQNSANQFRENVRMRKQIDNINLKRKELLALMKRTPKDDSKKYSLISPIKVNLGEEFGSSTGLFQNEYDQVINNQ